MKTQVRQFFSETDKISSETVRRTRFVLNWSEIQYFE